MVDVFRLHGWVLRALAVTLPGDIRNKWLQAAVDCFLIFNQACCVIWAILFFVGAYYYTLDNFMNRVFGVTAGISVIGSFTKYFIFRTKNRLLESLMDDLKGFETNSPSSQRINKVIKFYSFSVMMIIVTHNIHPLFETFHRTTPYYTKEMYGPGNEVLRDFLFGLYAAIITLTGNVLGDVIFLKMASQICEKLQLVANTFSCIGCQWDPNRKDVLDIPGTVDDELLVKYIVEEHNRIIEIKNRLQELFVHIIMAQLFYSFVDTCFTLFAISQCANMFEAIKELLPQFVALFLEIFLYCWGGELIHSQFELLHVAAYNSEWYNSKQNVKSSLLVVQSFTAYPVNINVGIFDFNFKFYETICRETFSYYTIMYQLFGQK